MKDLLKNYYNVVENIIEKNNTLEFIRNDKKYIFYPLERTKEEFNELLNLNEELINKNIPTNLFILNNQNSYITTDNNKNYCLLETSLINNEYNVLDMIDFNNKLIISSKNSLLYRNIWADLWSKKIDYFEYQISELGKDKQIILNSFSYYLGLAENAISYINNVNKKYQISVNEKITLQRKRVNFPNLSNDYFNPLNYIIDIEVRDIASYFQSLFFNSKEDLDIEINAYFKKKNLNIYGYSLLYARLLYPSYYFDLYESIMDNRASENELIKVINKVENYEQFLKDIYYKINQYVSIEPIYWLIKEL